MILRGSVINDHNYNIFLSLVVFYVLKERTHVALYDLTKTGTHQLGKWARAAGVQPA